MSDTDLDYLGIPKFRVEDQDRLGQEYVESEFILLDTLFGMHEARSLIIPLLDQLDRESKTKSFDTQIIKEYDPDHPNSRNTIRLYRETDIGRSILNSCLKQIKTEHPALYRQIEPMVSIYKKKRDLFFLNNTRMVIRICKSFGRTGRDAIGLGDMFNEGCIGLMRAMEKYNPDLGLKFSTYSGAWIRNFVGRAISQQSSVIRTPIHSVDDLSKIRKAINLKYGTSGEKPDIEELMRLTGLSRDRIESVLDYKRVSEVFWLNDFIGDDEEMTLEDTISSNEPEAEDAFQNNQYRQYLPEAFRNLSEKELFLVLNRYGFQNDMTLQEVGNVYDQSRETIRQTEIQVLHKLKQALIKLSST
jgi:RNA polymerase primary sigma factor